MVDDVVLKKMVGFRNVAVHELLPITISIITEHLLIWKKLSLNVGRASARHVGMNADLQLRARLTRTIDEFLQLTRALLKAEAK